MNDIVNHIEAELKRMAIGNEDVVKEYKSLLADHFASEDDYVVIQWPEVQCLMEEPGFELNASLANDEWSIQKYGSSAYFVNKQWLNKIQYGE